MCIRDSICIYYVLCSLDGPSLLLFCPLLIVKGRSSCPGRQKAEAEGGLEIVATTEPRAAGSTRLHSKIGSLALYSAN